MQRKEREQKTLQHQEARRKKEEEAAKQKIEDQRRKQEVLIALVFEDRIYICGEFIGEGKTKTAFRNNKTTRNKKKI